MENASKALIIAGAILLSILIIGIGMLVFNMSRGSVDSIVKNMSSMELQAFNAKFTQYAGSKQAGAAVQNLITEIVQNNKNEDMPKVNVHLVNFEDSYVAPRVESNSLVFTTGATTRRQSGIAPTDTQAAVNTKADAIAGIRVKAVSSFTVTTHDVNNDGAINAIVIRENEQAGFIIPLPTLT